MSVFGHGGMAHFHRNPCRRASGCLAAREMQTGSPPEDKASYPARVSTLSVDNLPVKLCITPWERLSASFPNDVSQGGAMCYSCVKTLTKLTTQDSKTLQRRPWPGHRNYKQLWIVSQKTPRNGNVATESSD
jgi:hypothetical protein